MDHLLLYIHPDYGPSRISQKSHFQNRKKKQPLLLSRQAGNKDTNKISTQVQIQTLLKIFRRLTMPIVFHQVPLTATINHKLSEKQKHPTTPQQLVNIFTCNLKTSTVKKKV